MSLNKIQLHPRMLTDLYPDVLVESGTITVHESAPIEYLGENQKNILIIVSSITDTYLPDGDLALLTSILSACKLGLADIALVNNYGKQETDIQQAIQQTGAKQVILFGVEPLSVGLPEAIPHFQLQQLNQRTVLCSPDLYKISQEKPLKSKLWASLKIMFGI
jgi:hypothetical protein